MRSTEFPRRSALRCGSSGLLSRALWVLLAVLLVPLSPARAAEPAPDLAAVLRKLASIEALSVRFREEKRMALLAAPLVSEGVLYYAKPRMLARHTERPRKSSLLLKDDTLTFGDAAQSQSISLSSQPAVRVLVETFVSVLAGDRAALERAAEITFSAGPEASFRIGVTPKDAKVKRLVRAMSFEGKGAQLTQMELVDATGDVTVTSFSDVVLRKPFSEAERKRLFRVAK